MPVYDFRCPEGHDYEVRCSIAARVDPHLCGCGLPGKLVILTAPRVNDTSVVILDYPGSKRLKAGYVHSHGPKMATRVSSGYGGVVTPVQRHQHPIGDFAQPEAIRPKTPIKSPFGGG